MSLALSAEVHHQAGTFTAPTRDLSDRAVALECDRALAQGEVVRVSLFVTHEGIEDERTPPLVVGARVAACRPIEGGLHVAELRFESITPAQMAWLGRVLQVAQKQG